MTNKYWAYLRKQAATNNNEQCTANSRQHFIRRFDVMQLHSMYRLSSLSSREQFTTWFGQRDDWKLRVTNERSERFPRERRRYVKRACFTDV